MVENKAVSLIFPTPVGVVSFSNMELFDRMANNVLTLKNQSASTLFEDTGNWCTNDDLNELPQFAELTKLIDSEVRAFLQDVHKANPDHFKMSCMWSNVHNTKSKHHIHSHPNSFLSGVVYLSTPDNPGNIFFVDPRMGSRYHAPDYFEKTIYNEKICNFTPRAGMMLLFPSWLDHGTDCGNFLETEYRISLSFNYVLMQANEITCRFK
jgi:uncharacterized protein (TIGR02466 family)